MNNPLKIYFIFIFLIFFKKKFFKKRSLLQFIQKIIFKVFFIFKVLVLMGKEEKLFFLNFFLEKNINKNK